MSTTSGQKYFQNEEYTQKKEKEEKEIVIEEECPQIAAHNVPEVSFIATV